MRSLTIRFDANEGVATPDGKAMDVADALIAGTLPTPYVTSSNLVVDALRLRRKEGAVDAVTFLYGDDVLVTDSNGRLDRWPKGFCDHTEKILFGLSRRNK